MQPFRPYVWLKKISNQYKVFFTVGIPANYVAIGLDTPADNSTTGVRTYQFRIEPSSGANAEIVENGTAVHSQPTNITKIKILVVEQNGGDTDKGETTTNYQDADDMA